MTARNIYTYYAWKYADKIYYTEEEKPTINSKILTTPDVQSDIAIDEAPDFYAFRSSANNVIYTKTAFSTLSAGDKLYTSNNEELGEIESVMFESVVFNDTVYYYYPSYNKVHKILIIDGKVFVRSSIDDVFIEKKETDTDDTSTDTENPDSTDTTDTETTDGTTEETTETQEEDA